MNKELFVNLRFFPPSEHSYSSPVVSFSDTNVLRCASSNACQISSSEYLLKGSRLKRIVPENNTGSCRKIYCQFNAPFIYNTKQKYSNQKSMEWNFYLPSYSLTRTIGQSHSST